MQMKTKPVLLVLVLMLVLTVACGRQGVDDGQRVDIVVSDLSLEQTIPLLNLSEYSVSFVLEGPIKELIFSSDMGEVYPAVMTVVNSRLEMDTISVDSQATTLVVTAKDASGIELKTIMVPLEAQDDYFISLSETSSKDGVYIQDELGDKYSFYSLYYLAGMRFADRVRLNNRIEEAELTLVVLLERYVFEWNDYLDKKMGADNWGVEAIPDPEDVDFPELKVDWVEAVDANTIEVKFFEYVASKNLTLDDPLVHGTNEVTFTYNGYEYQVTVDFEDQDIIHIEEALGIIEEGDYTDLEVFDPENEEEKVAAVQAIVEEALEGLEVTIKVTYKGGDTFEIEVEKGGKSDSTTIVASFVYSDAGLVVFAIKTIETGDYTDLFVTDLVDQEEKTEAVQKVVDSLLEGVDVAATVDFVEEGMYEVEVMKGEESDTTHIEATFQLFVYTVTFLDYDGTVLTEERVEHGEGAVAPEVPTREGYAFVGWDVDFAVVTEDLTVTAQYEIHVYTVTFLDYDGTVLVEESVEHGEGATAPEDPTREDYTFVGWDVDFTVVTEDLTVTAQYILTPVVTEVDVHPVSNITVETGTVDPAELLVSTVRGVLDDEDETEVDLTIDWAQDPDYQPNTPGVYIFTGTLSREDVIVPEEIKEVTVKVYVVGITAIYDGPFLDGDAFTVTIEFDVGEEVVGSIGLRADNGGTLPGTIRNIDKSAATIKDKIIFRTDPAPAEYMVLTFKDDGDKVIGSELEVELSFEDPPELDPIVVEVGKPVRDFIGDWYCLLTIEINDQEIDKIVFGNVLAPLDIGVDPATSPIEIEVLLEKDEPFVTISAFSGEEERFSNDYELGWD